MILTVNNTPNKVTIGNEIFECGRGESLLSIQSWANRWGVSKDTARNFFTLLEKDKMITRVNIGKSTRLTICNYDSYQTPLHVNRTTAVRTHDTNKEDKNENNRVNKLTLGEKELFFIKLFNELTGRNFKTLDQKTIKQFNDILKDNYKSSDFKKAISIALVEMTERGRQGYLTPEFITRPIEFAKYVNMQQNSYSSPVNVARKVIDHRNLPTS